MSISKLEIYQNNIEGNVNLMAVHSPLVFLIDATYSGDYPNFIYCSVNIDGEQQVLARCLYHSDVDETTRRFRFVAEDILRAFMPKFDDFVQEAGSFVYCSNISQVFELVFQSDKEGTVTTDIEIEAVHSARQFGESPCLSDVVLNNNEVFYAGENMPVYVYFYNAEGELPSNKVYLVHDTNKLVHDSDNLIHS